MQRSAPYQRLALLGLAEQRATSACSGVDRDPMSHRIIEKRRRDRMNNCLADLSRLIPAEYLKKGRGRVEKTEIIEMAIKHMQFLQSRANLAAGIAPGPGELRVSKCEQSPGSDREGASMPETVCTPPPADSSLGPVVRPIVTEHYRLGYQECLSEAMHFLVEVEGYFAGDSLCVKLISHLQKHCDKIVKGDRLNFPRSRQPGETTSSSGSNSSYGNGNGSGSASSGISSGPKASASTLGACSEESPSSGMAGSQLRDILCASPAPHHQYQTLNSHYDQEGPPSAEVHDVHHDAHLPYAEGSGSVRHLERLQEPLDHNMHPDQHQHHHSYKFKNTIKQRFCSEEHNGLKRRRTARSPSPPSSCSQQNSLPIFVLHTKGAFYIPLTVSYEVLAPYLDADFLSDAASSRSAPTAVGVGSSPGPGVVLHPVTISVNFQQYLKPPHHHPTPPAPAIGPPQSAPSATSLPWSRSDSGSMASFLPLMPWEACAAGSAR